MVPAAAAQPATPATAQPATPAAAQPATPAAAPVAPTGPIAVTCRCGKGFTAPPTLAGKQVACPSCRSPIHVPHPGASSAPSASNEDGFWDEIKSDEKTPQEIYEESQAKPKAFSPTQATSYAINRISKGAAPGVVYDELREKGVGPEESERIVEDLQEGKKQIIKTRKASQDRDYSATVSRAKAKKPGIKEILFSFEGRVPRRVIWAVSFGMVGVVFMVIVLSTVLVIGLGLLLAILAGEGEPPAWIGFALITIQLIILGGTYIVMLWVSLAVQIKRWHDLDKSGWWMLIGFVPVVGPVWSFIETGCIRGTVGSNEYGPDPT